MQEFAKIGWRVVMERLECEDADLVRDALLDGQPVKSVKSRSDVVAVFDRWKNGTSKRFLD